MNARFFRLFNFVYFKNIHPRLMLKSFKTTYEIIKWTFIYREIQFLLNSNVKVHIHLEYFHILIFYFLHSETTEIPKYCSLLLYTYIYAPNQLRTDYSASKLQYQILRAQICRIMSPVPEIAVFTNFYHKRKGNLKRKFKLLISMSNVTKSCLKIYTVIIFLN